ncbi:MAG: hypothetical protein SCH71_15845 [Desulfobulbaceae bacterium]|nr:hypothetical protein [Desulfobulbaceae bacterium]
MKEELYISDDEYQGYIYPWVNLEVDVWAFYEDVICDGKMAEDDGTYFNRSGDQELDLLEKVTSYLQENFPNTTWRIRYDVLKLKYQLIVPEPEAIEAEYILSLIENNGDLANYTYEDRYPGLFVKVNGKKDIHPDVKKYYKLLAQYQEIFERSGANIRYTLIESSKILSLLYFYSYSIENISKLWSNELDYLDIKYSSYEGGISKETVESFYDLMTRNEFDVIFLYNTFRYNMEVLKHYLPDEMEFFYDKYINHILDIYEESVLLSDYYKGEKIDLLACAVYSSGSREEILNIIVGINFAMEKIKELKLSEKYPMLFG